MRPVPAVRRRGGAPPTSAGCLAPAIGGFPLCRRQPVVLAAREERGGARATGVTEGRGKEEATGRESVT